MEAIANRRRVTSRRTPPSEIFAMRDSSARRRLLGGLSVGEVARRAGMSPSYLGRVLSGKRRPLMTTAQSIARATRLSLDEFYALLQVAVKGEAVTRVRVGAVGRKAKTRSRKR